jgi:hypothetical protein
MILLASAGLGVMFSSGTGQRRGGGEK